MMSVLRLGILGSTRGTHLAAIIAAIAQRRLAAEIAVVISNKPDALILERAREQCIPAHYVPVEGLSREAYDQCLSRQLHASGVECVVLIGYMRILSASFVEEWAHRIINVHPSLLPRHAGKADLAVHQSVLDAGDTESGCTVHYVTAEVDAGPVIVQQRCPVLPKDTPELLKSRVQQLEGEALIEALCQLAAKASMKV